MKHIGKWCDKPYLKWTHIQECGNKENLIESSDFEPRTPLLTLKEKQPIVQQGTPHSREDGGYLRGVTSIWMNHIAYSIVYVMVLQLGWRN